MHCRYRSVASALSLCALAAGVSAPATAQAPSRPITLDFPLLELPYNVAHGARAPGMQQSLGLATSLYEAGHTALAGVAPRHPWARNAAITAIDYFTLAIPVGDAWLHEEWHRAVLGHSGVDSRNDVWNLKNIFAEAISVSHVSDAALVRFKSERPSDFVRMKAAGYEAEGELVTRLEKDQFFRRSSAWHVGLYWLVMLNDQAYVGDVTSAPDSAYIDDLTAKANRDERTVAERDVSGHDFTAWVYHLFRPGEAFDARGIHPTGVGINRYVMVADLTSEEKRFLAHEGQLAWLNFLDPNLLGIRWIDFRNPVTGSPARGNVWLRHSLTSFGDAVDAHILFEEGDLRIHAVAERFANHDRRFPGFRLELVDVPVQVRSRSFEISPRMGLWSQPRDQRFMTTDGSLGGLAGVRISMADSARLHFYIDAELKGSGWVAGRPALGSGASLVTGVSYGLSR